MARNQTPRPGLRVGEQTFVWLKDIDAVSIAHERGLKKSRGFFAVVAFVLGTLSILLFAVLLLTGESMALQSLTEPHLQFAFLPLGFILFLFDYAP